MVGRSPSPGQLPTPRTIARLRLHLRSLKSKIWVARTSHVRRTLAVLRPVSRTVRSSVLPHSHEWDVVRSIPISLRSSSYHKMSGSMQTVFCDDCSSQLGVRLEEHGISSAYW